MRQSAIEKFTLGTLQQLLHWVGQQDRFILLGFLLAVLPVPPLFIVGGIISLVNLALILTGRLSRCYLMIVTLTILVVILNGVLVSLVFSWLHTFWLKDYIDLLTRVSHAVPRLILGILARILGRDDWDNDSSDTTVSRDWWG